MKMKFMESIRGSGVVNSARGASTGMERKRGTLQNKIIMEKSTIISIRMVPATVTVSRQTIMELTKGSTKMAAKKDMDL